MSCSGARCGGARRRVVARRLERHAEEHAVIAGVDLAVLVGVVEELRDVEPACRRREKAGWPVRPGRSSGSGTGGSLGRSSRSASRRARRARGEAGADALDVALDGHVHQPAAVGRDGGAGQVALDQRARGQLAADAHVEHAQVALDRAARLTSAMRRVVDPLRLQRAAGAGEAAAPLVGQIAHAQLARRRRRGTRCRGCACRRG